MNKIPIKRIKQLREEYGFTHLVILGIGADGQHVATHGKTQKHANEAANMGNHLKRELSWPAEMCNAKPLERKCENCSFWQRKKLDHSYRIPENWPGKCMFKPDPLVRYEQDIACGNFEPNR